ncbi:MAG TPA: tetratricopeptide repeat protein, partial [Bacteroidia bacterium]|nr:tetratricopeptide repeat protein [Bacteroidia bacterium]
KSQTDLTFLNNTLNNSKSDTIRARACLHLSNYYANNIGDSAIYYSNKALEFLKSTPNKRLEAWAYRSKANGYFSIQDYNEAVRYLFQSIKLYESLKDTIEIARTYQFAGSLLYEVSSEEKSLYYLHRALTLIKNKNHPDILASIYNDFSYIYTSKENYDSSLYYQQKAYEIDINSESTDKIEHLASDEHNLGAIYYRLGNYSKAEEFIRKSYTKRIELGYKLQILSSLNVLNAIAFKKNDYQTALKITEEASKLAHELKSTRELITVYDRYKLIYYRLKKYDLSYDYCDSLVFALYKLNDEESTRISNETEAKFQNQKKELENTELKSKNELSEKIIKQQKTMFYVVVFALITAVALVYFIYTGLKKQRSANKIIEIQKQDAELKNKIIEEKQKEILDSIHYAKRIQNTLLAHREFLSQNLPEHFILFKPKDIVSGDFYWATSTVSSTNNRFYLAVCDSTGHGVPGAFMSLLNIGFLSEAINEKGIEQPGDIFNHVRNRLINSVSKDGQQDGFDGILLCIDKENKTITYSAANNAPILINSGGIQELNSNRMPVGKGIHEYTFVTHTINYSAGDKLYLYTDGYADQFGGPKGKKFKYRQLNELLMRISDKTTSEQYDV